MPHFSFSKEQREELRARLPFDRQGVDVDSLVGDFELAIREYRQSIKKKKPYPSQEKLESALSGSQTKLVKLRRSIDNLDKTHADLVRRFYRFLGSEEMGSSPDILPWEEEGVGEVRYNEMVRSIGEALQYAVRRTVPRKKRESKAEPFILLLSQLSLILDRASIRFSWTTKHVPKGYESQALICSVIQSAAVEIPEWSKEKGSSDSAKKRIALNKIVKKYRSRIVAPEVNYDGSDGEFLSDVRPTGKGRERPI